MHIHLVGVAGTGMGSLAGLLAELGHRVSGSDVAFHPPMGPALKEWGIECRQGFLPDHLEPAPDLVVIGNVCRPDNPEARAAIERNLDITHMAGALQRFALSRSIPLVVSGTHGKTTTSSLCAWLLHACGANPGFFIGGIPGNFGRGFRAPTVGSPLVIEGDEYDTAYFEKTAKFLHYRAHHAVITAIEHDHIDIYPTAESYSAAFERFVAQLPSDGTLVANSDDPEVVRIASEQARCPVEWYGLDLDLQALSKRPGHSRVWTVRDVQTEGSGQRFLLCELDADGSARQHGEVSLPLCGEHNLANALAALVSGMVCFNIPFEAAAGALTDFRGSKRRQELLATPAGIRVYDDFAHHPTAVDKTLRGLRARHPEGRLFAVFEPRSATACRRLHQAQYPSAFGAADEILIAPVGRPELGALEKLDTERLACELRHDGKQARAFRSSAASPSQPGSQLDAVEAMISHLCARARCGDTIALLSNGAFGGIHAKLIDELGRQPAADPS